jgi:hypothetical protein
MNYVVITLFSALALSCTFNVRPDLDGSDPEPDATNPDAPVLPTPDHLILSEIKGSRYSRNEQFIEIYNPTGATIALADVYLSDSPVYPRLPAIVAGNDAVTIEADDFVARFPANATLAPGEVAVMSLATPFAYGEEDFSIQSGVAPVMGEAFSGSVGASAQLTEDHGEAVALFFWDGRSDLVIDVDLMIAGRGPMAGDALIDKTGLAIDGPDADPTPTTYPTDGFTIPLPLRATGPLETYQRIDVENGEILEGGNGITGHDETTENISASWDFLAPAPFEPPPI